MILSILIPTYNRAPFLKKNLEILKQHLLKIEEESSVELVISNNFSSDDTDLMVKDFISLNPNININYFFQTENIGLEKNALAVLNEGNGEYVMFLGDDDFIEYEYLKGVLEHLKSNLNTHCIIPSFFPVDLKGNKIGSGRDLNSESKLYDPGFKNCLENSWRGHQLSGLVFKRDGLYSSYVKNNINNIYLFIYFTSISCITGCTYHFTNYPVKVSDPGQENKDWNYGDDGLIFAIFDNYKNLPFNQIEKTLLQLKIIRNQPTRIWSYKKKGNKTFLLALNKVWLNKNSTFLYKILFPLEFLRQVIYRTFIK